MQAQDIMTRDVVTVRPEALVQAIARLLLERGISGVPVVDATGQVLGLVTEGDLLRRPENETEAAPRWWLRGFGDSAALADAYTKSHGLHARDVMTRPPVTVPPTMPVGDVAALMERRHIKRVPVVEGGVEGGRLVGLVTRANLLRGLAGGRADKRDDKRDDKRPDMLADKVGDQRDLGPTDREIHARLRAELARQEWASPWLRTVTVENGRVDMWGFVASEAERRALRVVAERTPGVVAVEDHLTVRAPRHGIF
jgi:CBS domain-containing protein